MTRLILLLAALALVVAACGSDNSETAAEPIVTANQVGAPSDVAAEAPADVGTSVAAAEDTRGAVSAQDLGRSIVFRASMVVAVTDVRQATADAIRLMARRGGVLFGQDSVGLPDPASTLVFRILPADFQAALDELSSLGDLRSQTISADDVTDRVVDLESRIATAAISVERLRGLIEEATDLETITDLETQLLERETLLETLRGQLRTVQDQVDLATITVTLTEALARPAIQLQVTAYPGHEDEGASCPGSAQLSIEENTAATVCFEITNVGDTPLTAFDVRDPVLDLEMGDLISVFGDPDSTLEPGEFLILAAKITPERTLRTQSRATAVPVNADGEALEARAVSATTTALVQAVDPGGLPGFGDGLTASWDLLLTLRDLVVLLAGLAIPFLWVPVAIWALLRRRRRRATPPPPPASSVPVEGPPAPLDDPTSPEKEPVAG